MLRNRILLTGALALALAGTSLAQTWTGTTTPGFGNSNNGEFGALEYGGFLYVATENSVTGMEVWRHDGVGAWTPSSTGGFGDANNTELQGAAVFGGDFLVITGNTVTGVEVWTHDGATWTQVNVDGFGNPQNQDGELVVLNNTLYAVTYNFVTGCGVQRYNGGSSWTPIGQNGLGGLNPEAELAFWNGNLYAGTSNPTGCEVLQYQGGTSWTRVDPGNGFDASAGNNEYASLYVYNNVLYAATENYQTGTETWEYQGGTSWVQRNTDGFGDANNADIEPALPFNGALYIGTISSPSAGGEVWRYDGGSSFTQVSLPGYGSTPNLAIASLAEYGGEMYGSTFNLASGTEVWRYVSGTTWTRVDPGSGFGQVNGEYAQLVVFKNELYAVLPDTVWRLEPALTYCTGKTNSAGCVPFITTVGSPSVSSTVAFTVTGNDVAPSEAGFIIYGTKKSSLDFHGAKLCVKLPFVRTPVKGSKNTGGGCSGWVLRRNFNATIQSGTDPSLTAGRVVTAQYRQRDPTDPAGFGDGLTNGVRFTILP